MAVHYEVQVLFLYKRLCETCAGSQRKPEDNLREKIALRSNLGGGLSLILTEWIGRLIPFQDTELKKRVFFRCKARPAYAVRVEIELEAGETELTRDPFFIDVASFNFGFAVIQRGSLRSRTCTNELKLSMDKKGGITTRHQKQNAG